MSNPWNEIPLSDYEGHMALPEVGQSNMLSDELEALLARHNPQSLTIIGCAGGNGFDQALWSGVQRIVGIDINPTYLQHTQSRYAGKFPQMDMYCADIEGSLPPIVPTDLVYAALIFEYVDLKAALVNIKALCTRGGTLAVLLQLPSAELPKVSASPFTSLHKLASVMQLVPPEDMHAAAIDIGFSLTSVSTITLESHKTFSLHTYTLPD